MKFVFIIFIILFISSCSYLEKRSPNKLEYKTSQSISNLEVPPDLTAIDPDSSLQVPEVAKASIHTLTEDKPTQKTNVVLPNIKDIRIESAGEITWLVVKADEADLWPKLLAFWPENGLMIKTSEPALGIMETEWAENRATLPNKDIPILGRLFNSMYSTNTRDKFRLRLEKQENKEIAIYLSHQGIEQVVLEDGNGLLWQPRPSDPQLEAEVLKRLAIYLGLQTEDAETLLALKGTPRSELKEDRNEKLYIHLTDNVSKAWIRTGVVLARLDAQITNADKTNRIYTIITSDNKDNPTKRRKKPQQYEVYISPVPDGSTVKVMNKDGGSTNETEAFTKVLQKGLI